MKKLYFFYKELKRRNVIKAGISYLVVSWVVLQVIALLGGILNAPPWLGKTLLITLIILLPIWLLVSWYYEITPDGFARTNNVPSERSISQSTSQKFNLVIIGFLLVALVLLVVDRFRLGNTTTMPAPLTAMITNENSIVVLPFRDLSPKNDQEFFADGLAEELLNALTHIPGLKVTSRTSAFHFKNTGADVPTIATKLGVNYILEGSVRKSDSLLRITIKLIDSREDKSIWSDSWDRKMENIFSIQNSIANAVVTSLQVSLKSPDTNKVNTTDPKAYERYLEAKFYIQKNSNLEMNYNKALKLINESIAIDSSYAPAWATKSDVIGLQSDWGFISSRDGYDLSEIAAKKSIAIDPTYALGYIMLSKVYLERDWDVAKAQKYINKALSIAPNDSQVIGAASTAALIEGDINTALRLNIKEISLDPLSVNSHYNLSITYYYNKEYEKAIEAMKKSIALEVDQEHAHFIISLAYVQLKDLEKAIYYAQKEPSKYLSSNALSIIYWFQGDTIAAQKELDYLLENSDGLALEIASIYASRNQNDLAFLWLEKLLEDPYYGLLELRYEPSLLNLHDDARWDTFLKNVKPKG